MAFTLVDSQSYHSASSNSIVIPAPTASSGDIMFALLAHTGGSVNSVPSGWTLIASDVGPYYGEIYYKVAGGSEPANYTFGLTVNAYVSAFGVSYEGDFDTGDPIDVSDTPTSATGTTIRFGNVTTSADNSPLIAFGYCYSYNNPMSYTKPSIPTTDWVEDIDNYNASSDFGIFIGSMEWSSSGATGNVDGTKSISNTNEQGFLVALNPAVEGGGTSNFFQLF